MLIAVTVVVAVNLIDVVVQVNALIAIVATVAPANIVEVVVGDIEAAQVVVVEIGTTTVDNTDGVVVPVNVSVVVVFDAVGMLPIVHVKEVDIIGVDVIVGAEVIVVFVASIAVLPVVDVDNTTGGVVNPVVDVSVIEADTVLDIIASVVLDIVVAIEV